MKNNTFQTDIISFVAENIDLPISLKSFNIKNDGSIYYTPEPIIFKARFTYHNFIFNVHIDYENGNKFMRLHSHIGHIPYSYESSNKRANILALLFVYNKIAADFLKCDDCCNIFIDISKPIDNTLSPESFMQSLVESLLEIRIFLILLENTECENGEQPTAAPACLLA
jgi:hypothetical protein